MKNVFLEVHCPISPQDSDEFTEQLKWLFAQQDKKYVGRIFNAKHMELVPSKWSDAPQIELLEVDQVWI